MRKISMSKIKEVLRLKYRNELSNRQIQTMTGVSRNSVANYMKSYLELGSALEEVLSLSDADLAQLFTSNKPSSTKTKLNIFHPDWCKDKNRTTVEYALKNTNQPMGVATYKLTESLPFLTGQNF